MSLEKPIYDLLQKEPFFANFILNSRLTLDDPQVKRAAVSVRNGEIRFFFNSEWLTTISRDESVGTLKHEVLHCLLDHTGSRGGDGLNREVKNIAMDCAINQHIHTLPSDVVTLETLEKQVGKKLASFESWEYYYEHIKQKCEQDGNIQYVNDHHMMEGDGSEECDSSGKKKTQAQIDTEKALNKAAVKNAAEQAIKASAGNVPDYIAKIVSTMSESKLPWKQILRNFVANARSIQTRNTRNKLHRRFELDQPGKKKLKKLVIGVCADSSGSVSDESYQAFMTEVKSIAKNTTMTHLVHADCVVQRIDKIKDGKAKGEVLKTRHGCGGTAYQPAIDKCKELKCDAIIYFGDGDCADTPTDPKIPFLWVLVGNSESPGKFGRVLRL